MVGLHNFIVDNIKNKQNYVCKFYVYYNTTRVEDGERRANAARNTQQ